jgi:hypothetical protein
MLVGEGVKIVVLHTRNRYEGVNGGVDASSRGFAVSWTAGSGTIGTMSEDQYRPIFVGGSMIALFWTPMFFLNCTSYRLGLVG